MIVNGEIRFYDMSNGWMPIKEAPKSDYVRIDLWVIEDLLKPEEGYRIANAYWCPKCERWEDENLPQYPINGVITHYREIPKGPIIL